MAGPASAASGRSSGQPGGRLPVAASHVQDSRSGNAKAKQAQPSPRSRRPGHRLARTHSQRARQQHCRAMSRGIVDPMAPPAIAMTRAPRRSMAPAGWACTACQGGPALCPLRRSGHRSSPGSRAWPPQARRPPDSCTGQCRERNDEQAVDEARQRVDDRRRSSQAAASQAWQSSAARTRSFDSQSTSASMMAMARSWSSASSAGGFPNSMSWRETTPSCERVR